MAVPASRRRGGATTSAAPSPLSWTASASMPAVIIPDRQGAGFGDRSSGRDALGAGVRPSAPLAQRPASPSRFAAGSSVAGGEYSMTDRPFGRPPPSRARAALLAPPGDRPAALQAAAALISNSRSRAFIDLPRLRATEDHSPRRRADPRMVTPSPAYRFARCWEPWRGTLSSGGGFLGVGGGRGRLDADRPASGDAVVGDLLLQDRRDVFGDGLPPAVRLDEQALEQVVVHVDRVALDLLGGAGLGGGGLGLLGRRPPCPLRRRRDRLQVRGVCRLRRRVEVFRIGRPCARRRRSLQDPGQPGPRPVPSLGHDRRPPSRDARMPGPPARAGRAP